MAEFVFSNNPLNFGGGGGGDYLTPPPLEELPAITRYVAPETGSDAANGLTPATAWRYPPGDSRATHGYTAVAGDHIAFKGGETYHGRCATVDGAFYSGNQWGMGRCTIDGAAPVTVRLPVDAADAGGHAGWASGNIYVAEWAGDGEPFLTTLFDEDGALCLAPALRNPEYWMRTDISRYSDITYKGLGGQELIDDLQITSSTVAAAASGEEGRGQLWIRTSNNQYVQRTVTAVAGSVTTYEDLPWPQSGPTIFYPYTDGNQEIMLFNCVKHVTQAGDYATLSDGKAIFWTRGSLNIRRGVTDTDTSTRPGFSLSNRNDVTLRGFRFTGFVNRIIFSTGLSRSGWVIQDNLFEWCELWDNSAIALPFVSNALISHNRFRYFIHDSNCVAQGGASNAVEWNVAHGINATAFQMISNESGNACQYNICTDANGIHGNGISPYQAQTNLTVSFNAIIDCMRPLTTQGTPIGTSGRLFEGNVFHANLRGNGWGWWHNGTAQIEDMVLRRNLCIGWAAGILIHQRTVRTVMEDNWSTDGTSGGDAGEWPGVAVGTGSTPDNRSGWTVTGATAIAESYLTDVAALLEVDRVDIPRPDATRLALDLRTVGI